MTETAPLVTVLDAENISKRAGSIGRVAMHVDARIVDDDDRDVATDTVGELIVRGPNVFAGYWMKAEASAEALRGAGSTRAIWGVWTRRATSPSSTARRT